MSGGYVALAIVVIKSVISPLLLFLLGLHMPQPKYMKKTDPKDSIVVPKENP